MRRFLILTAFFVGASLTAPVAMRAGEHHDKRYYDRDGHDYHAWNDQEDRAYRVYLENSTGTIVSFAESKPPNSGSTSDGATITRTTCSSKFRIR